MPTPTVEYKFAGNLVDSRAASTITAAPGCPQSGYTPCNSSSSFGSNLDGDYWSWQSTSAAGGGLTVATDANVGTTYTMSLKFSLSSVAAGTNSYSKIVDYRDRSTDDGFYFHFGKLKYFPGPSTSPQSFANNDVLDLVTVRQATGPTSGTFTVYMLGPSRTLTKEFVYTDTNGSSIPSASGIGSLFGFFFDDAKTPTKREASPSGRVYSIKLWSNTALSQEQLEAAVVPPSQPISAAAVDGDASAQISWDPVDGATSYTAIAEPGGASCTVAAPATTCLITGLTNGSNYAVTVTATNANGASQPSEPVDARPRTVPDAPSGLVATGGDGDATIAFTEEFDGGSPITNYEYSLDGTSWTALSPAALGSPVTIPGLANGVQASVYLRAVNAVGQGAPSSVVTVTPVAPVLPLPGPPTNLVPSAGDARASVTFSPGADNGSPITNYEYSLDGGLSWTALSPSTTTGPANFGSLTNGTTYELVLRSVNARGASEPSERITFTPATIPEAPTSLAVEPGEHEAWVSFALNGDGGSPITHLEVSIDGGSWTTWSGGSLDGPINLAELENGVSYSVRIRAVNAIGPGPASDPVAFRLVSIPEPPIDLSATTGETTASIAFTENDDGGSPITSTEVSVDGRPWEPADLDPASSDVLLSGLDPSSTHTVSLRSLNAVGASKTSSPVIFTLSASPVATSSSGTAAGSGSSLAWTGAKLGTLASLGATLVATGLILLRRSMRRASRPEEA